MMGAWPACTTTVAPPSMVISTGLQLLKSISVSQVTRPSFFDPPVK
jgi:hypothetical protein